MASGSLEPRRLAQAPGCALEPQEGGKKLPMTPGSGVHQCRTKLPMQALHSLATRVGWGHYGDQGIFMEISVSWIPETNQEISFCSDINRGQHDSNRGLEF